MELEDLESKAYQSALNSLCRREHSPLEIKQKLTQKGFDEGLIEEVLERLIKDNYLSEERFIECFIRSQINRGYGPNRIKQALTHKGIDSEKASHALESYDVDWFDCAKTVFVKKFKTVKKELKEELKQRRFMLYRGFESECINRLFKEE